MEMPTVIKNPIPPEITKKLREAVAAKGYYVVISKVLDDGRINQFRYRSNFSGEHWKLAYDELVGDFLSIQRPAEVDQEGLG